MMAQAILMATLLSSVLPTAAAPAVPLAERHLPDVFTLNSGQKVTAPAQWETRRAEILELFRANIYGRAPLGRPASLSFHVEKIDAQAMDGAATLKLVTIKYLGTGAAAHSEGRINLILFVPNKRTAPAAAFLLISNHAPSDTDATRATKSEFWPAEEIVARGYAAAVFRNADVDEDKDDGFRDGVHGLFDPPRAQGEERAEDAWGTIAAWAWGASRVLDYLESDGDIDAQRVAVVGHSRGGKAALWAGASDRRFALTVSNNSGSSGAALARGKSGESVAVINKSFPHWFARRYKSFGGRESELPIDQHELLALIAPRPLYIASAASDKWADPESEFLAGVAASPVYKLLGRAGLESDSMPEVSVPLQGGSIGYHVRPGGHGLTLYDWERFMDFADKRMIGR